MFLAPSGPDIVLWLHVLAATVWIGGQVTIGVLIPLLRGQPDVLAAAARRFQQVAWTAFALLIVTGIVNIRNAGITWHDMQSNDTGHTLVLKLGFAALSGAAAAVHALVVAPRASSRRTSGMRAASGLLGALSLLFALAAALYGVTIAQE